ncbi:hypothetical protein ACIQ6K_07815, partial [Streptomyces sp. NPDC096354]|uniref:hypothetical protein n=1 Tax=Streptomyces sp. NPDC096354 TaxID=3366088 RepID=UPI00381C1F6A
SRYHLPIHDHRPKPAHKTTNRSSSEHVGGSRLSAVAAAVAAANPDRAEHIANDMARTYNRWSAFLSVDTTRATALSAVAKAVAVDDPDRAAHIANTMTDTAVSGQYHHVPAPIPRIGSRPKTFIVEMVIPPRPPATTAAGGPDDTLEVDASDERRAHSATERGRLLGSVLGHLGRCRGNAATIRVGGTPVEHE